MDALTGVDRTALPEGLAERRAAAEDDAAHLLTAESLVRPEQNQHVDFNICSCVFELQDLGHNPAILDRAMKPVVPTPLSPNCTAEILRPPQGLPNGEPQILGTIQDYQGACI